MKEDLRWFVKRFGLVIGILCLIIAASCIVYSRVGENVESPDRAEEWDKGYYLPIEEAEEQIITEKCMKGMEAVRELFTETGFTDETAGRMQDTVSAAGNPTAVSGHRFNMDNYERMEQFLEDSADGKKGRITVYEIHEDGGIGVNEYRFDGDDMYLLNTNAVWNENQNPVITTTSYTRIQSFTYTEKGWFGYELCAPQPPEVTEVVNANVLLRVRPLKQEYLDLVRKYLLPIGYRGNNLFSADWDLEHMEALDYNGLYQFLYAAENRQKLRAEQYPGGVPKEEFEMLMMKYLPVTGEQLENYAEYDAEKDVYPWAALGYGNQAPNAFGTSVPEITELKENEDGTVTLTVDAVCEMMRDDAVISHQLTVKFLEDGGIQFFGNKVI